MHRRCEGKKIITTITILFWLRKSLCNISLKARGLIWESATVCSPCSYICSYVSTPVCFQKQMADIDGSSAYVGRVGVVFCSSPIFHPNFLFLYEKGENCTVLEQLLELEREKVWLKYLILFAVLWKSCKWYGTISCAKTLTGRKNCRTVCRNL